MRATLTFNGLILVFTLGHGKVGHDIIIKF